MRKTFIVGFMLSVAASSPVLADVISNINIPVSETWELVSSNPSDDGNLVTNIYHAIGDEYVVIAVQDTSFLSDDMKTVADLYLFDCDQIYQENDNYYLMTDATEKIDGMGYNVQECIFTDGEQWEYVFLGSRNHGDYVITLIYQAPTLSTRESFKDFLTLYNDYIFE